MIAWLLTVLMLVTCLPSGMLSGGASLADGSVIDYSESVQLPWSEVSPEPRKPAVDYVTGDTSLGMLVYSAINGTYIPQGTRPTAEIQTPGDAAQAAADAQASQTGQAGRVLSQFRLGSSDDGWRPDGPIRVTVNLNEPLGTYDNEALTLVRLTDEGEAVSINTPLIARGNQLRAFSFTADALAVYAILGAYDAPTESWSVTFLGQDDAVIETRTVAAGDPIGTLPEAPAREGYSFVAWVSEEGIVDENTIVTSALTLRASYQQDYPATVADAQTEDLQVHVEVPEGALPADARFRMTAVNSEDYREAVEQALGMTTGTIKAVDMTFVGADGAEYQPLKPVTVQVTVTGMGEAEKLSVVHIADNGEAEVVYAGEPETIKMRGGEDQKVLTFAATGFSVYAVVDEGSQENEARMTMNFFGKDTTTPIATMYVKNGDTPEDLQYILYDPGVGTLEDGEFFMGWYIVENDGPRPEYTNSDIQNAVDIDGVRSWATGQTIVEGTTVNVYALIYKVYTVSFVSQEPESITVYSEAVMFNANEESVDYLVNVPYVPINQNENFNGWYWSVPKGELKTADGETAPQPVLNNTTVRISSNTTFRASAPKGYWLIFNENGSNASYTPPQFIPEGQVTQAPSDNPRRKGYTFGGWYTNPEGVGSAFTFNSEISAQTNLYAKWIPVTTADYTVLIWKQKVDGDGYDFAESILLSGSPSTIINTVSATGTGNNRYAQINGINKQYTGFHLNNYDTNVTIVPEGNAVVNVYYDRNEYTLSFQVYGYTYTVTISNNGTQYGIVGGKYVQIQRRSGTWYYGDEYRYYGERYTRSKNQSWNTVKEIKALYEQNISDQFPIVGTNGITYNNGERWDPQKNSLGWDEVMVIVETMPAENVTFRLNTEERPLKTMNYYVSALPSDQNTVTFRGVRYKLYKTISARYNGVTEEDFIELDGFTKYTWADANGNSSAYSDTFYIYDDSRDQTINFYYTRDTFVINYMDGLYVDGDDRHNTIQVGSGKLGTSEEIPYQADISSYNKGNANYYIPSNIPDGYIFGGWYLDSACTQECTFTTMPKGGITVYAKWIQKQYRVLMHPNVPNNDPNVTWGNQSMSYRVNYNEQIAGGNMIKGDLDGYEFVGWYFDEACTRPFEFNAYVLNDSIAQPYAKTEPTELNNLGLPVNSANGDINRDWVVGKLDLYGKWRVVLDRARGINVVYSAHDSINNIDGSNAPTDNLEYKDNSPAYAGAATTSSDPDYYFDYWVVQKWNGTAYEDTEVKVYPGDQFNVLAANAKIEPNPNPQGENDQNIYTVQLRAQYKHKEEAKLTYIPWFKNDGTAAFHIDTGETTSDSVLLINEAVPIQEAPTRIGRRFLGWARVNMGATDEAATTFMNTSSNWTQDLTTPDLLWYNPQNGKYYTESTFTNEVTKVAADEAQPHQALFAVWESNKIIVNKQVKVLGDLQKSNVNHTVYFALRAHDSMGTDGLWVQADGTLGTTPWIQPIEITNGMPQGNVIFAGMPNGQYDIIELASNSVSDRMSVGQVFGTGENAFQVKSITFAAGNNNITMIDGVSVPEQGTCINTYIKEQTTTEFFLEKGWMDRQANAISAPGGASATIALYKEVQGTTDSTQVATLTIDGTVDAVPTGEGILAYEKQAWTAFFDNLPSYDENGYKITYKAREISCTPAGFYPYSSQTQNGNPMGANDYMSPSGRKIWNRKLTGTLVLRKHFDFQPNDGNNSVSYSTFGNDQTSRAILQFTLTGPDGYTDTFTLADTKADGTGKSAKGRAYSWTWDGNTQYDLFLTDMAPGTYTVTESGQEHLLENYNYYFTGSTPDTGSVTKTANISTSPDEPRWDMDNIENRYRFGTVEQNALKLKKTISGLNSSQWNNHKNQFQTIEFYITRTVEGQKQYYVSSGATHIDASTGRITKLNWSEDKTQAAVLTVNNLSYNLSGSNYVSGAVNLQNWPNLEVGTYGLAEKDESITGLEWNQSSSTFEIKPQYKTVNGSQILEKNICEPEVIDVTNTYSLANTDVPITKTVVDESAAPQTNPAFNFTATLDGEKVFGDTQPQGVTLSQDKKTATFSLTHNDTVSLNVPINAVLTVTEAENAAYTTTYQIGTETAVTSNEATYTVPSESVKTIAFTNTRKIADVTVTKTFSGIDELPGDFTITNDFDTTASFTVANRTSGDGTAESPYTWTVQNVPVGTEVTFTESGFIDANYSVKVNDADNSSGTAAVSVTVAEGETQANNAAFKNVYSRKSGSLTISKTVVDASGTTAADKKYNFTVTLSEAVLESYTATAPEGVTVTKNADNKIITFSIGHQQQVVLSGLPVGATYTVAETEDSDYIRTDSGKTSGTFVENAEGITVVYTNTRKLGKIKITKQVVDQAGEQLSSSEAYVFTVKKDSETFRENITITGSGETTLENIPLGTYTVEEAAPASNGISGYVFESTSYDPSSLTIGDNGETKNVTVTNRYIKLTEATATKAWQNADGSTDAPDGASVVFTLYADGTATDKTITLDGTADANGESTAWTATFADLPEYKIENGTAVKIAYTIKETGTWNGYTSSDAKAETGVASGSTITNAQEKAEDVIVTKAWRNADGTVTAPSGASVTFTLYSKTGEAEATPTTYSVVLDGAADSEPTGTAGYESAAWTAKFVNLPKYAADGTTELIYTVAETGLYNGYTVTGSPASSGGTITNAQEETSANAHKAWENADGTATAPDGAAVVYTLYADGDVTSYTVTLDGTSDSIGPTVTDGYESEAWKAEFVHLPKYKAGTTTPIVYTIAETTGFTGYTASTSEPVSSDGTITNTQDVITVIATKVWEDNNNQDGKRENVTFVLNGTYTDAEDQNHTVAVKTATDEDDSERTIAADATEEGLTVSWTNVAEYVNGYKVTYTLTEKGAADNKITMGGAEYSVEVTGDAKDGFVVTNSYTPEKRDVTASKIWMNGSVDVTAVIKNAEVTFTLQRKVGTDGEFADATQVTGYQKTLQVTDSAAVEAWTVSWNDLPRYENGQEIAYQVVESGAKVNGTAIELPETTAAVADDYGNLSEHDNPTASVSLTNTLPVTERHVIKQWIDQMDPDHRPENVTFTLSAKVNEADVLSELTGYTITSEQSATGEAWNADWTGLPVYTNTGDPIVYDVTESEITDYTQTDKQFNAETHTWTIVNTLDTGELTVKKMVEIEPASAAEGKAYSFTVQYGTKWLSKNDEGEISLVNSQAVISIVTDGEVIFEGIPVGTYTVTELGTEENGTAQIANYTLAATQTGDGKVTKREEDVSEEEEETGAVVTLVNTYTRKLTPITLKKIVTGNLGNINEEFSFMVTVSEDEAGQNQMTGTWVSDPTVKHTQDPAQLGEFPVGAWVTITEIGATNYTTQATSDGTAPAISDSTTDSKSITFRVTELTEDQTPMEVVFGNYANMTIATGIRLDFAPYVLIMAMAILGAGLLLYRQKRRNNW